MSLRLYDSRTRAVRDFVPDRAGEVSMYVCGITVQGPPHIGHMRVAVAFDVVRRWLTRSGYDVTMIRNVTDIDDKILIKAAEHDVDWWKWAYRYELVATDAYNTLGVLPPSYEPRATGHITEMIDLIGQLIERGHAYASGGDVYFDVHSWPRYGELTGTKVDELQPAGDTDAAAEAKKRDPRDFALWKGYKSSEPESASWPTPWGRGRPGWHLECSAMARRYLGPRFDIHGGGIDLRFPHHENEIAQSCAAGDDFAQYWMHNAWVTLAGEKMSKSLGNTLSIDELTKTARPVDLRFYLATVHYRSTVDFSDSSLGEARAAYGRIEGFIERSGVSGDVGDVELPAAYVEAMNDDIGVSGALAVVYDAVRQGNSALGAGEKDKAAALAMQVRAMLDVLGLDPLDPHWADGSSADLGWAVDDLLAQRTAARKARDFARADEIRDTLAARGISIEDTPDGPKWSM
ncbi:cysteine--tRNA ligase [Cumulibacter manganitolerans]|uniref:cysteine--tRNA ligase n=1 Tax=Cumulibacter manganitolerans TaxID=1884992 RepID=UPI00129696C0|nr:cysteine--tRNA ligase [Cumulibacter manganitolerans]